MPRSLAGETEGTTMKRRLTTNSFVAFTLAIAVALFAIPAPPADAAIKATSTKSYSAATLSWGAYFADPGTTPSPAPYVANWITSNSTQFDYLDLINSGDIALIGATFDITTTAKSGNQESVPKITFESCVGGTWNQLANKCSGTITSLGNQANGLLSPTLSIAKGARLSVRLSVSKTSRTAWKSTINVQTDRTDFRAGTTSNS